jgi:hypothetical protein
MVQFFATKNEYYSMVAPTARATIQDQYSLLAEEIKVKFSE